MSRRHDEIGVPQSGPPIGWRDQLSLRAARVSAVFFTVGTLVVLFAVHGFERKVALAIAGAAGSGLNSYLALTGKPTGKLRAWFVVIPPALAALTGFATVGFLAGPAVVLALTVVFGGILLGKAAMHRLLTVVALAIALIAWMMVDEVIQPPRLADIAMDHWIPWLRTMAVMILVIGLMGTVLVQVVHELEHSIEHARRETERRHVAEQAKAQAELSALSNKQLETVGQLAAGVAHDFNNNLAAIMGSAELMKEEIRHNRISPELLDDILASSQRAAQLTRQLLVYSRKAQMVLVPTDLHQLVEGTVAMLRRSIDPKVQVVARLDAEIAQILADGALLDNALLNLLVNARDAMPRGGTLTISTSNYEVHAGSVEHHQGLRPGPCVLIEVMDTGEGIDRESLPRIFEPFYTTKPVGKGTGLGLAAVSGTIKSLKGLISVESEPHCGTAFRILLPCEIGSQSMLIRDSAKLRRGSGHILLVDDEPLVRRAAAATLRSFGYTVEVADDGAHAIEVFQGSTTRIDLVILDLRMPRMDGAETFRALRRLSPGLPVVIWSGYGGELDVEELLRQGATAFIQKPYAIAELSQVVYAAVAGTTLAFDTGGYRIARDAG